jgi:hypothetical protein
MSTRYSRCREIHECVHQLVRQGWRVWHGGKHYRVQHPNGFAITVPGSPGDRRSALNFFAQLQRAQRINFQPVGRI